MIMKQIKDKWVEEITASADKSELNTLLVWHKVVDKKPKSVWDRVLVRQENKNIIIACYFEHNGHWQMDDGRHIPDTNKAVEWMLLPH